MSESSNAPSVGEPTLEDFYHYFSRWKDAYPGGIPLEFISTVNTNEGLPDPQSGSEEVKAFFHPTLGDSPEKILFLYSGDQIPAEELTLLTTAIQKGLSYDPRRDVALLMLPKDCSAELSPQVSALFQNSKNVSCVALGPVSQTHAGIFPKERFIETVSLKQVLEDPRHKRTFWEAIKPL